MSGRRTIIKPFGLLLACGWAVSAIGCGSSPITADRIEDAIAPTFANLVHLQVSALGLTPIAASDFEVIASCRKMAADTVAGGGDWECHLRWFGPDRQMLRDKYELVVTTDGCYTATVAGESLGGPTVTTRDGRRSRNLLYAFEGCFDTT